MVSPVPSVEGTIPFVVNGKTHHTWYKVFGNISDRSHTPLIGLHGGPGLAHDYLLSLSDLTATASIPVILYDQIGGGRSTYWPDEPESFWTVDLFIDELVNLINYFDIQGNFDIVGHSWGGMLGAEYAIRRQPKGLKHLILTNSMPSWSFYNECAGELLQAFPKWVQEGIAAGWTNKKLLYPAMREFHSKHGCILKPMPKEFTDPIDRVFRDDYTPTVELKFIPKLDDWDIRDQLHLICVPSLVINGQYDAATDAVVRPFYQTIPKVKWRTFQEASHTPMWEQREEYMKELLAFLAM